MTSLATGIADARVRVPLAPPARAMAFQGVGERHREVLVDEVELAPGEALVAIELATVCGSDLHTALGHRASPVPSVLGHEQVGRVVAVGAGARLVDGEPLSIGDRVVWSVIVACGACRRCERGRPQKCERLQKFGHVRQHEGWMLRGGFASHAHVRAGQAVARVDDVVPAEVLAPVPCATATAWAAVEAAGEALGGVRGSSILVLGAGLVGLTAAAIAASRGAAVTLVDPDVRRARRAVDFGAEPAVRAEGRFDAVVEAAGVGASVSSALAAVDVGGVVVLVGSVSPVGRVVLDPEAIVRGLVTIRGVHNCAPRQLCAAVDWMHSHHEQYPFAALVAETHALASVDVALAAAASGPVRVGLRP